MPDIKLTENAPTTTEARAEAIAGALKIAASDPGFRLAMILGEAYQDYAVLIGQIIRRIARDESSAPGVAAYAQRVASDPGLLLNDRAVRKLQTEVGETQIALLRAALAKIAPVAEIEDAGGNRGTPQG